MYFTFYGRKVLRNYAGFTLRSWSVLLTPALFERTLYQNRSLWNNKIEKCHRNCQVDVIIGICKILFECEFWSASTTIYKRKENNYG